MKNRYFSDEESEVIDEGEEVAHKKSTVDYFSNEEEVVEVEEFTKSEGEVGTEENDSIKSRSQGLEVKPSAYRSMGRTTKRSYFSDDDEFEEIENITGATGLHVNELDSEEAEEEEEAKEEGDFTLQGVQEGKVRVYKLSDWVYGKLYPHQKDGINWLWGLHCKITGGILGDDMGLGKTMQVYPTFVLKDFRHCVYCSLKLHSKCENNWGFLERVEEYWFSTCLVLQLWFHLFYKFDCSLLLHFQAILKCMSCLSNNF